MTKPLPAAAASCACTNRAPWDSANELPPKPFSPADVKRLTLPPLPP